MADTIRTHGGRRSGAGRKPGNSIAQPTTVIRVPTSTAKIIKSFVSTLVEERPLQTHAKLSELIQFARTKHCLLYTSPSPRD